MRSENPQVGVRLPPTDDKKIEELVEKGKFLNRSDFIRRAISEKLAREAGAQ